MPTGPASRTWSLSLSQRMLAILAASVIAVSAPAAFVFYWFTREAAIADAEQFVEASTDRRILGLNYTLRLAAASLARTGMILHDVLRVPATPEELATLRDRIETSETGMLVNRREGFSGENQAGIFMDPRRRADEEFQLQHLRAQRLITYFAGVVVPPLDSLWLLTRQHSGVIYMPSVPDFVYHARPDQDYLQTEWMTLGSPAANPKRALGWTKAAYDPLAEGWMVSAVLPLDIDGEWVGTIGHDLFLEKLTARLFADDQIAGTEHFLVGADGQPIVAGRWQTMLSENRLTAADRAAFDQTIAALQNAFAAAPDASKAVHTRLGGQAVSVLMRPVPEAGWRYYVATPISGMVAGASKALLLFGLTATASVLLVAVATHMLVRRQIVRPVRDLAATVRSFAAGDSHARTKIDRDDDIGDLGRAFNTMADRITAAHEDLTLTQEELQHRNAALLHANRAKTNFLANMSHELRTPLNAIIGFAEILRHRMFGPLGNERYDSYIEDIQRSGQHLLSLINDVLDMSRVEAGRQPMKLEHQPLRPLIERSIRMTQPMAENRSVRLEVELDGADLTAHCDSRAVIQMVVNLISNAIKFSPPGGAVSVKLEPSAVGGARISIADSGPGIDEAVLPNLFEAYAHRAALTKSRHDGVGLGLAITKALVELHHGNIRVVSQPGRGTTMTLELPPTLP